MIPAYKISAEDLMEVVYAVSQIGPHAEEEEIITFTGFSERRVRESIKLAKELELIEGDESYSVLSSYRQRIAEVSIEDRDVLLNRALIQYRPFRTFGQYIRKGYSIDQAAEKANVIHDISSDSDYIEDYFIRFGEYADILEQNDEGTTIEITSKEIPVDSVESVEALRSAIESEGQIRFYLEETIGSEIMAELDEDTEDDLVKSFSEHAESPRDSITASGRALEDFLRDLGRTHGSSIKKYANAGGAGELADELKGDAIIREVQRKRASAISDIRNKGGAHGDDRQTGDRWRTSAELALNVAMESTLLIASIQELVDNGNQQL